MKGSNIRKVIPGQQRCRALFIMKPEFQFSSVQTVCMSRMVKLPQFTYVMYYETYYSICDFYLILVCGVGIAFSTNISTHTKPCLEYVNTSCRYKTGHFVITAFINLCQATDAANRHHDVGQPDPQNYKCDTV